MNARRNWTITDWKIRCSELAFYAESLEKKLDQNREWVGLDDDDMAKIKEVINRPEMIAVAAFIEARLKEKNS